MDADKLRDLQIKSEQKQRPHRSLWVIFLCVIAATALAVYYAWPRATDNQRKVGTAKPDGDKPADATVTTSNGPPVRPGDAVLTFTGYIINRERIELSPRFMGVVKWIGVHKGDVVTNGQVLVLLDDAEYKARLREAEGSLANTRVALEKAELDYRRVQKLIADKVETQQTADDLRLRVDGARATLKQIEGVVELQRTYLDWTIIRSPINGVVLEKLVDANELVVPQSFGGARGPSTALVAIADPKDLQVEIDLNEADLAKVYLNQPCRVSPEAYRDKIYPGFVAEIAPEASRQKGTLQIKVQIKNPDRFLTPELSAKVDFLSR